MADGGFEWWPVERVTTDPLGTYLQVFRDAYWVTNKAGDVLVWRSQSGAISPQCNTNEAITTRLGRNHPGAVSILRLPLAFTPIRIEDYR